jgi:hypothetical protein
MAVSGVTVTVALPVLVESWTDVAVIVTLVLVLTACPVKTPFWVIVPTLVPHETALLKVPVPVTVAVHWLVCPDSRDVGAQLTLTAVIALLLEPPPPQAAIPKIASNARIRPRTRKLSPETCPIMPFLL